jgi:dUTP pyrophosphatase
VTTGPTTSKRPSATDSDLARSGESVQQPTVSIRVRRLDPDVPLPSYALDGDAGADLVTTASIVLKPGQRALLPTGLAIAVPYGYAGFVHPRSGLAIRAGLGLVNAPGTIDAGYRGEIKVIVINHDPDDSITLHRGDRIAQLVIQRVEHAEFVAVDELTESARGESGHGSTGGAVALRNTIAGGGYQQGDDH